MPRAQLPEELRWGWRHPRSTWSWGWHPPTPELPGLGPCPRLGHGPWSESLSLVPGASAFQALPMQGSRSCIIRAQRGERGGQALTGGLVLCSSSQVQAYLQAYKAKLGTVYSLMLFILGKNMQSFHFQSKVPGLKAAERQDAF